MSGWAAAAQVAAQIADKFIDSRRGEGGGQNRQFQADFAKWQLGEQDIRRNKRLQEIVVDAKKAGLHPLFALGGGGPAGSPGLSIPGGSYGGRPSGGAGLGAGVSQALSTLRQGKVDSQTARMQEIAIKRQEAALENDYIDLTAKKAELAGLERQAMWGDGLGAPGTGNDADVKLYAYGTKQGPALHMRPLKATARSSIPETIEIVGADGYRYQVVNPDLGDEVAQGHYVWEKTKHGLKKIWVGRQRQGRLKRYRDKRRYKEADYQTYGGS